MRNFVTDPKEMKNSKNKKKNRRRKEQQTSSSLKEASELNNKVVIISNIKFGFKLNLKKQVQLFTIYVPSVYCFLLLIGDKWS